MDKLLKIGTGICGVLAAIACLSTVGIVGYALVGGVPDKSPEEVYQAEIQAHNEEMQDIHMLSEATHTSLETPTPLYDEHIHNYIESMDVKANCYREGRLKYACDTCGDIYYIDVPMTGHRSDDEWTVTREATPNLVGLRVKYCIYCDQIVAIEDIPYTSEENSIGNENHIHNYTSTIEREPTCIFAGLRKYTCSCGYSYTEPIHASGHVASDWEVAAEATTAHNGTEQRMCRVCGILLDSRPIDAKRESPKPTESPVNTVAPTETPTRTPEQTNTPRPTNIPRPTNVPAQRPTVTPSPTTTATAMPTSTPTVRPTNTPTTRPTATPDERIYGLGDTWKVDGQWELTFDKVTVTEERNNYSGKNPKQVLIVDYTYKNTGYENDILGGLYFSFFSNSQIVDSTGLMGYDYSLEGLNSPKYVPVDASCDAQDSLGLDNKSSEVKIIISKYDGNEVKRSATFVLPISEETVTPTPTATPTTTPEQGDDVFVLEESSYTIYDSSTIYNIVIKNNGKNTVRVEGTGLAIDANKDILASGKDTWNALAPGHTGCLSFWLHDFKKEDILELKYELDISDTDCIDMSDFITYNVSKTESGIMVECVNESDKKIYSVSPHCMFYNNGMNVYYNYSGLHSLNPNENFFEELKCNDNNSYDSYKIFVNAWNLQ